MSRFFLSLAGIFLHRPQPIVITNISYQLILSLAKQPIRKAWYLLTEELDCNGMQSYYRPYGAESNTETGSVYWGQVNW